jgi:hypothetical protein
MQLTSIEKHIQLFVEGNPNVPRKYYLFDAVKLVASQPDIIQELLIGLILVSIFVYIGVRGSESYRILGFLLALCIALLSVYSPVYLIRRIFTASKYGFIGEAEVIDSKRMLYGLVNWKCIIRNQHSIFEYIFASKATWIITGIKLKVVLHPKKNKILFVIGVL